MFLLNVVTRVVCGAVLQGQCKVAEDAGDVASSERIADPQLLERRGGGEMVHRAGVADGMFAPGVSHESGDVKARGDVIGLGIGC